MTQRRKSTPEPLARALGPIIDRLGSEGHFGLLRVARLWPEVVGEAIARRTELASLRFHTLLVKVSGAMWVQELSLMREQIRSRLAVRLGEDLVREIRFVRGALRRRRRPPLSPVARQARQAIELPEIKDPELKRAFDSLVEAWGRAPR